jgi:hypothetical protein
MVFCEPRKTLRFCHLRPTTCGYDVIRALTTRTRVWYCYKNRIGYCDHVHKSIANENEERGPMATTRMEVS